LSLPEIKQVTSSSERSYFSFIKGGIRQAFSNKILIRIFLYSAIIHGTLGMVDEYHQVLLSSWLSFSNSFIGVWLAISFGVGGISAWFAHRLRHKSVQFLNILAVIASVSLIMITLLKSQLVLGLILLLYALMALMGVLIQGIIQREITSDERATITSVNSLLSEAGAIILGLSFGFVAHQLGIQVGYGFFGVIIIIYLAADHLIRVVIKN